MTIKTVTTLLVGASSELLADSLLKSWSLSGARTTYSFGLLVYTLSAVIWASTLHDEPMSKSSVFFFATNGMLYHHSIWSALYQEWGLTRPNGAGKIILHQ